MPLATVNGTLGRAFGFLTYYWFVRSPLFMSLQTPEPQSLELPLITEERAPSAITVLLAILVLFAALTAAYVAAEVVFRCDRAQVAS